MEQGILHNLQEILRSSGSITPEMIVTLVLPVVLITGLVRKDAGRFFHPVIVAAGLLVAAVFVYFQYKGVVRNPEVVFFSGLLHIDSLSVVFKFIILFAGLLFIGLSLIGKRVTVFKSSTEYYIIFLGILLGSMLMTMASNLLMIYVSIEIVSVSSYLLTPFNFNKKSTESGIKYLLFGAVASAIMLYGISLLYGFTGDLDLSSAGFINGLDAVPVFPRVTAITLFMSGLFFKMAVVPFHIWTPDVYEGAPVPLIAFFSVTPKLAGLVIFTRTFFMLSASGHSNYWMTIFGTISILTMFTGNFAALRQSDAKRMMGYSSIAHSGYLMIGILALSTWGLKAVIIHAVVLLLMNYLVFMLIELFDPSSEGMEMENFRGLFRNTPAYASLMAIGFISLIGIPPTGGFTSKFILFSSAWEAYTENGNNIMMWLVISGVLNTLISLFYYLKIPYYMAFRDPENGLDKSLQRPLFMGLGIFLAVLIIIIFLRPDGLVHILNSLTFAYRGMAQ